jgi:hypothetical protein
VGRRQKTAARGVRFCRHPTVTQINRAIPSHHSTLGALCFPVFQRSRGVKGKGCLLFLWNAGVPSPASSPFSHESLLLPHSYTLTLSFLAHFIHSMSFTRCARSLYCTRCPSRSPGDLTVTRGALVAHTISTAIPDSSTIATYKLFP